MLRRLTICQENQREYFVLCKSIICEHCSLISLQVHMQFLNITVCLACGSSALKEFIKMYLCILYFSIPQ